MFCVPSTILPEAFAASCALSAFRFYASRSQWPKDVAAATLLHSQVYPTAVQGVVPCGVKNALSAMAAREHPDKVYRTSGHRAATDGILKGIPVCIGCVDHPERLLSVLAATEPGGPEQQGVP